MKIFITADLHYRERWFWRLLSQAADYDLVCIAGDLLDMFREEPRMVQAREVSRWIRELAKVTWVAICSGNHDNAGRQVSQDRAPVYDWLVSLGREPKLITDGVTHVLDDLIVTTVPYHCSKEQKSVWLDRGAIMRRQRGGPWLVLHHIPPIAYPGYTKEEAEAAELLRSYRPEYFISGHSHEFPYFPGSSWAQRIDGVNVLVPGQLLSAPFPNHVILNTE
jgi:predicted phosphodiesterase